MADVTDLIRWLRETSPEEKQAALRPDEPLLEKYSRHLGEEIPRAFMGGGKQAWESVKNLAGQGVAQASAVPSTLAKAYLHLPQDTPTRLDPDEVAAQLVRSGAMTGERFPALEGTTQALSPAGAAGAVKGAQLAKKGLEVAGEAAAKGARTGLTAAMIGTKTALPLERPPVQVAASARVRGRTGRGKAGPEDAPPPEAPKDSTLREDIQTAVEQAPAQDPTAPGGPLEGFGTGKERREKRLARKAEKQAASDKEITKQTGKAGPEATQADVFRRAWDELHQATGDPELATAAIQQAAEAGEHLKPKLGGGYAGAPRWVLERRDLRDLRDDLDDTLQRSVDAINYADPYRMGTWYSRAKSGQADIHEPHQLDRGLEQTAVYSAGVSPESETAFKLRHANARALGTGETAYRGAGARTLDLGEREIPDPSLPSPTKDIQGPWKPQTKAELKFKIGEYRGKNDPGVEELSPFGVNDFRHAQNMGYLDPQGQPWTAGASDTMHAFMDAENALSVLRANQKKVGGISDWSGAKYQETPWILGKAEDLYNDSGATGKYGGGVEGMVKALRDANSTIADYVPKHGMSMTTEAVPGQATGHIPELLSASKAERDAYSDIGRWGTPTPYRRDLPHWDSPYRNSMREDVGAGDRDPIYRAMGMHQVPVQEGVGEWTNSLGQRENNKLLNIRVLTDFLNNAQNPGSRVNQLNTPTLKAFEAAERTRGLLGAQDAMAGNLPVTGLGRSGKTSMLLEREGLPSVEELAALNEALQHPELQALGRKEIPVPETGGPGRPGASAVMGVTPTNRGALVMANPDLSAAEQLKVYNMLAGRGKQQGVKEALGKAYPGATPTQSDFEGLYLPETTSRAEEAGQGLATGKALQAWAEAPEQAARNVGESEEVRKIIGQLIKRDEAYPSARPDIQKTRQFFRDSDWPQIVDYMRRTGKPAAAAATALGYSLEGMAAEPEAQR